MPGGRPSTYTPDIADRLCKQLAEGMSLRRACELDDMPSKTTVLRWLRDDEEFRSQYARARDAQADHYADEIIEISDNHDNDYITKTNSDGSEYEAIDHEHIQRSRLRVDSRKWIASKLKPKKYGDRTKHEHSGPGDGAIEMAWTVEVVEPKSVDD